MSCLRGSFGSAPASLERGAVAHIARPCDPLREAARSLAQRSEAAQRLRRWHEVVRPRQRMREVRERVALPGSGRSSAATRGLVVVPSRQAADRHSNARIAAKASAGSASRLPAVAFYAGWTSALLLATSRCGPKRGSRPALVRARAWELGTVAAVLFVRERSPGRRAVHRSILRGVRPRRADAFRPHSALPLRRRPEASRGRTVRLWSRAGAAIMGRGLRAEIG
jgi:hypothetical protein